MSVDWEAVRGEFPALRNWTYLNTATFGQLPRRATEAVARHFARRDEMACWDFLSWYDDMERVRQKAARLIHANADDIAFIANASTALGILLAGLDWRTGDRILTLEHEFPNNLYAPGLLDRRGLGALLRFGGCAHASGCNQLSELQHRLHAAAGRDRPIFA